MSSPNPNGKDTSGAVFPLAEAQEYITLLEDVDWQVRLSAVKALAKLKDPQVVLPLLALLKDRYSQVRDEAAGVLAQIGDLRAVEPLATAHKERNWWESHNSAGLALILLGSPTGLPLLILSSSTLSPTQKAASLQSLIGVTVHLFNIVSGPFSVQFEIRNVQTFCEDLCRQDNTEASIKQGAEAVLAELQNRIAAKTLLRAGSCAQVQERQELLRGLPGHPIRRHLTNCYACQDLLPKRRIVSNQDYCPRFLSENRRGTLPAQS